MTKKLVILYILLISMFFSLRAQEDSNPIIYGAGHLLFTPDARSRALAGVGAATSPDAYSTQSNPSKLAFIEDQFGLGISYEPKFSNIDVESSYFTNFSTYFKPEAMEGDVIGIYLGYYKQGESEYSTLESIEGIGKVISPIEASFKFSYSSLVNQNLAASVDFRLGYYDYGTEKTNMSYSAGLSFLYQTSFKSGKKDIDWDIGGYISDIGPKVGDRFLPTNLKLGTAIDFPIDREHLIEASFDINKLLVPSPPVRSSDSLRIITGGKDDNVSSFAGILQSLSDAPGGMSEELKEINYSVGIEYSYDKILFARLGYFSEDVTKGLRSHIAMGAGVKYSSFNFDMSYLYSLEEYSALTNQIMFTLRIEIDKRTLANLLRGDFKFDNNKKTKRSTRYRRSRR